MLCESRVLPGNAAYCVLLEYIQSLVACYSLTIKKMKGHLSLGFSKLS